MCAYSFYRGYTITHDDAYISFRYAANLANGQGLVFNPGERVYGFTSPLQVLLLGLLASLGFDIPALCLALAFLWISLAACLVFRLSRGIFSTFLPAFVVAFYALTFGEGYSYLGLETNLLIFLQVWFLFLATGKRHRWAAFVGSLACLARPDAIVLVGPVLLATREGRRAESLAIFLGPGLAWMIFTFGYYGEILPNTFFVKKSTSTFLEFVTQIGRWVVDPLGSVNSPVTGPLSIARRALFGLVALSGFLPLVNRRLRQNPALLYALVFFPWVLIFAYGLIGAPTAHRWEYFSAFTFLRLSAVIGILSVLEGLAERQSLFPARHVVRKVVQTCMALLCLPLLWSARDCFRKLDRQQADLWYGLRYRDFAAVSDWINRNVPRNETLQVLEVGVVGYLTNMRMIDMAGLTTKDTRPAGRPADYGEFMMHYRPSYVLLPGRGHDIDWPDLHYRRLADFPGRYSHFSLMARVKFDAPARQGR